MTKVAARPPLPPLSRGAAIQKVRLADAAWNSRDRQRVALAYTADNPWCSRSELPQSRAAMATFLTRKWQRARWCGLEARIRTDRSWRCGRLRRRAAHHCRN